MRFLFLNFILFSLFILQEFLAGLGLLPIDLVSPFVLWVALLRIARWQILSLFLVWGIVVDTFSSIVPGPTVLAYATGIFLVRRLKGHLDIGLFLSYAVIFSSGIFVVEILRLLVIPLILDLQPPRDILIYITLTIGFSLAWGFVLWTLTSGERVRDFFVFR